MPYSFYSPNSVPERRSGKVPRLILPCGDHAPLHATFRLLRYREIGLRLDSIRYEGSRILFLAADDV
jgi:hypothetical protein